MSFRIAIATDNDAFGEDPRAEIVRILRDLADNLDHKPDTGNLQDSNGNHVGTYTLVGKPYQVSTRGKGER